MLRASELEYDLPPDLIATRPAEPRDSARLMVVSRSEERPPEHHLVRDLPRLLRQGDCLIFNTTRVLPARLEGERADTGGRVEGLFLSSSRDGARERWEVLLRGRRLKEGVVVHLHAHGEGTGCALKLVHAHPSEPGGWTAELLDPAGLATKPALEGVGRTPLPPYILKARRQAGVQIADSDDRGWYQTVFATQAGSVAAPTAGLHFTPDLLAALAAKGIERADVVLHVGTGTFRPVEVEHVEAHEMHAEMGEVGPEALKTVERARAGPGRVIAVGSTSARAIESFFSTAPGERTSPFETRLLITPGYRWRALDGLLTNFHLPRSTLLAMVAAMFPGGIGKVRSLYETAIQHGYRFYSYGDAMLILP